eukprot:GHRR01017703.1.p1 GENE.GHRR01017703.1~~GHRR01017703.1.p1  ORF type:complete len:229 (+),score=54.05 GHRR01017703.1:305-991(+)
MQRSHALTAVKAAAKMKILAKHARARLAEREDGAENGVQPEEGGLTTSLIDSDSVQGGSPTLSRPVTPRSDTSLVVYSNQPTPRSLHPTPRSLQGNVKDQQQIQRSYWRDFTAVKDMVLSSKLNVMMVCVPLGIAAELLHWGAYPTFILNFLALIPLALLLGDVTEDLAARFGDTVGGLLNATFGNVVEMILSIAALRQGLYQVVSSSLLGSILSNLLLVLGALLSLL